MECPKSTTPGARISSFICVPEQLDDGGQVRDAGFDRVGRVGPRCAAVAGPVQEHDGAAPAEGGGVLDVRESGPVHVFGVAAATVYDDDQRSASGRAALVEARPVAAGEHEVPVILRLVVRNRCIPDGGANFSGLSQIGRCR